MKSKDVPALAGLTAAIGGSFGLWQRNFYAALFMCAVSFVVLVFFEVMSTKP